MSAIAASAFHHAAPVEQAGSERYFGPLVAPRFDRDDLRIVSMTFGFAAGLVLAGALACDLFLLATAWRIPGPIADVSARHLAADLLPWAIAFTTFAGVGTRLGLSALRRAVNTQT